MQNIRLTDCLGKNWQSTLAAEFKQPYFQALERFLTERYRQRRIIYPSIEHIFQALNLTPPKKVKAVILGQDPYHGPGQAHGLAFSVPSGQALPPSLRNIFRELESDLALPRSASGCLEPWARQGVLLLNAVLTVEQGRPGSHQGQGWEIFTDHIIKTLNTASKPSVFMLWGSHAQKKQSLIDQNRHRVLLASHPSPLSAHRGFFGSRPFSRCNDLLQQLGREPIDWRLP